MKKWTGGLLILVLTFILVVSYSFTGKTEKPKKQSSYDFFNNHPPEEDNSSDNENSVDELALAKQKRLQTVMQKPKSMHIEGLDTLYRQSENMTKEETALLVWGQMKFLFPRSDALPETSEGIKQAVIFWEELLSMIEKDKALAAENVSTNVDCPYFVKAFNTTLSRNDSSLEIPCGLIVDSSITIIGIPVLQQDNFQIELVGPQLYTEEPPIVLRYSVFLPSQNLTKEPFTVQNTWTKESGWGKEEKCPNHSVHDAVKVDGLTKCNSQIGARIEDNGLNGSHSNTYNKSTNISGGTPSSALHFVEGSIFTATLLVGEEGFHMTVNGRHETSFAIRDKLEPWLVNRINVKGGLTTVSLLAKGLPVTEDVSLLPDVQILKAMPLSSKRILLLVGVFSAANNFERRMALRRTWMKYDAVQSGDVVVRFFIGLHMNKELNFKLWKEAQAYGDIQLMPFVDYYNLLTYKTIGICIFGTKILSAKYIMKTDDDAFVRIDELLSRLDSKPSDGLLYGSISYDSEPHRDKENKWYISDEEWPHSLYPPWAHGPGYIISHDIAKFIVQGHKKRELMLFKLEDVGVGIWIEQFEKKNHQIHYEPDDRFYNAGCEAGYILAHYQNPRMMLCLWEKLRKEHKPECCED